MGRFDDDRGNSDRRGGRGFRDNDRGGSRGGRDNDRRGGRGFRDNDRGFKKKFGPREMHKAICSDCGSDCEVPFKPTEGKPVYCLDCFKKKKR